MTAPTLPRAPRLVLDIAVRAAAVVGFTVVYDLAIDRFTIPGDAPIGFILLGFVIVMLLAAVAGTLDGFRLGLISSAVVWTVAGLVAAVAIVLLQHYSYPSGGFDALLDSLREQTLFLAGLVFVPAVVCAALSSTGRPPGRRLQHG